MRQIAFGLLLAIALPCAAQQDNSTLEITAQDATRCGAFYKLLSGTKGPEAQAYQMASAALFQIARSDASPEQLATWIGSFSNGIPTDDEAKFTKYLDSMNRYCGPLAAQAVKAYIAKTGPEASAKNKITKRHKSKRPAEAQVFGETVTYSDADGASCETPIVQAGTTDREARIRAQYMWLDDQLKTWKLTTHSTKYSQMPNTLEEAKATIIYSAFDLTDKKNKQTQICFDTTASAKPELLELISKQH